MVVARKGTFTGPRQSKASAGVMGYCVADETSWLVMHRSPSLGMVGTQKALQSHGSLSDGGTVPPTSSIASKGEAFTFGRRWHWALMIRIFFFLILSQIFGDEGEKNLNSHAKNKCLNCIKSPQKKSTSLLFTEVATTMSRRKWQWYVFNLDPCLLSWVLFIYIFICP